MGLKEMAAAAWVREQARRRARFEESAKCLRQRAEEILGVTVEGEPQGNPVTDRPYFLVDGVRISLVGEDAVHLRVESPDGRVFANGVASYGSNAEGTLSEIGAGLAELEQRAKEAAGGIERVVCESPPRGVEDCGPDTGMEG